MFQNLSHWVTSYVDWNLSLDLNGGPNYYNFSCDAPIIINKTSNEFYKNPIYYVLGHFSKFMPPGSKIMNLYLDNNDNFDFLNYMSPPPNVTFVTFPTQAPDFDVQYIGSLNEDGSKTIIFYNP